MGVNNESYYFFQTRCLMSGSSRPTVGWCWGTNGSDEHTVRQTGHLLMAGSMAQCPHRLCRPAISQGQSASKIQTHGHNSYNRTNQVGQTEHLQTLTLATHTYTNTQISAQMLGTNPFNYCCVISFVGAVYEALSCFTWPAVGIHTVAVWSLTSDSKWIDFSFLFLRFHCALCQAEWMWVLWRPLCSLLSVEKGARLLPVETKKSSSYSLEKDNSLYWNVFWNVALTSLGEEEKIKERQKEAGWVKENRVQTPD